MSNTLLSNSDRERIHETVRQAESSIAAEIVPVFARASAAYEPAYWRGGLIAAAAAGVALTLAYRLVDIVFFMPPWLWLVICFTSGLIGAWLVCVAPRFRRILAGTEAMNRNVQKTARALFHEHDVTDTCQRTGIMIFVSFFERQAVILCDYGIDELVPQEKWQDIVDNLTRGIAAGDVAGSICRSIKACTSVVEGSGIRSTMPDDNELGDQIRSES